MDRKYKELPIFSKAKEIAALTKALTDTIDEEVDRFHIKEQMLANAYVLASKVAGAEGASVYRIRMENAVLIKLASCELLAQASLCKAEALTEADYIQLLRDEMETFRQLFLDWVENFDRLDNHDDGWGIFNG